MSKPPTVESTLVLVRQLGAVRDGRMIFEPVSFEATAGQIVELRGANGAGKTTVLRILAGLVLPATGHTAIRIDGRNATPGDIHLVGHGDTVKTVVPVAAQARYWAALLGVSDQGVSAALDRMGLGACADIPGRALSAGMRRRLALMRLVLADRRVWLLDEPFATLDTEGRKLVAALVAGHTDNGGIVIAAMHGPGLSQANTVRIGRQTPDQSASADVCDLSRSVPDRSDVDQGLIWRAFTAVLSREATGDLSHRLAPPLAMYLGCASLVPLAAGPEDLENFAPPMTIISLALAALLPAERIFGDDLDDGTLDSIHACCTCPAELLALARLVGVWVGVGLPLAVISPVAWLMLGGPLSSVFMCTIVAALASGGFVLFAGLAASLSVTLARSGVVMIVVALPFFWPMMIFATATLRAHASADPFMASLSLTASALLFALAVTPFAVARALRATIQ